MVDAIDDAERARDDAAEATSRKEAPDHARRAARRWLRFASYGAVFALTIAAVIHSTRARRGDGPTTASGHAHGADARGESMAQPVTLGARNARRIGVTYAPVTIGSFGRDVRTVAQVTFDETTVRSISPKIDGWVERLIVNATGQYVREGQPMLTIYSPMLVTAQEELLLAKRLLGDVASGSMDARTSVSSLLASARRRLSYWDIPASEIAEIERSGEVRRTLTLRAPAGGYVLEKNVLAGQKIMGGEPLYEVVDLSRVWLEGEVFERDLAAVRVGQRVHTSLEALPGRQWTGRIAYIYPTLNPETRTVRIRVVVPNRDLALKPGMYATMRISGAARADVLTVPRAAVLSTGQRSIVFVREANDRLAPREVALGASSDERIEILRGLAAGETVVASATFLLDAESNLGKALGGMGDMPGMDMTTPTRALATPRE